MTLDISDTLAPDSDQLDAVDLAVGPRTFTVTKVVVKEVRKKGDQPVDVYLAEFPRVWRPGKSMRRVLAACWGGKGSGWVGRRVRLYCDPTVRFGDQVVGGTRVSHLSHIDASKSVPLLISQGRSAMWKVDPLVETAADRIASYKEEWLLADPERKKAIEAEVAALSSGADAGNSQEPGHVDAQTTGQPQAMRADSAPDVPVCPECTTGKHINCSGQAWDSAADEPSPCQCTDESHKGGE